MAATSWYQIGEPRAAGAELCSARAHGVLSAIDDNPDFELLEIRYAAPGGVQADIFLVSCTCDGVPSKNVIGIEYREPLAIVVSSDRTKVPEVRPLRRNFPVTIHQNAVLDGDPLSLCLYEQRSLAILRTWTAPSFLRRIQWWLTETAHNRLHQAEQPLEQLFFESPDEITLPIGYLATVAGDNAPLIVTDGVVRYRATDTQRKDPAYSLILGSPDTPVAARFPIRLVSLRLPPITHGAVEREPSTLGGLEDQLAARGAGVMDGLIGQIKAQVGDQGCAPEDDIKSTVLLLFTPIRRTPSSPPERHQVRAFWVYSGLLPIGEAAGALIRDPGPQSRYYINHPLPGTPPSTAWRSLLVSALTVHALPDPSAARQMSGVQAAGPKGVIAGAGSLGSALLDLWRRSGWGQWSVIDLDHLKPHNLIRHTAHQLGSPKAEAVAARDKAIWRDIEPQVQAIVGDAGNLDDPRVTQVLGEAQLTVDATTTVEVPRRLANTDLAGRVVSAFITPSGDDSVLIAEDGQRRLRIDALEAQYWRAVLNQQWGEAHVARAINQFRSGASCRDISVVMPYSSILAHAATLAEQIQTLGNDARIRIWQRDRARGSTSVHDVPIAEPLSSAFSDLTVVWDRGILEKVRELRQGALPAETGGVLVGYHDLNEGRIYVVDALNAPADSIGTPESFERGVRGLTARIAEIERRSAGQIGYLGEWHSHPKGYDAGESGDDIWQLFYLGDLLRREDLPALMLIVAEEDHQWLMAR